MRYTLALAAAGVLCLTLAPRAAIAHCDTLDGPVVKDARAALDSKDVTAVLKWVRRDKEPEQYTGAQSDPTNGWPSPACRARGRGPHGQAAAHAH